MTEKNIIYGEQSKKLAILSVFIAILFASGAGCNSDASDNSLKITPTPMITSTPAKEAKKYSLPTAEEVAALDKIAETKQMIIETSKGTIKIEFYPKDAPLTVANFMKLAEAKYYDGIIFHRVIANFMIQGGDPTGTGTSGPGYQFKDELNTNNASYKEGYRKGVVAMANAGPNTNGSQFFIMLRDMSYADLAYNYTIFGKVVSGQEAVDAIGSVKTDGRDRPLEPVAILKAYIEE